MTASHTKESQYHSYIKAWEKRLIEKQKEREHLRKGAYQEAQALANIFYTKYSATSVYLFGSLLEKERFNENSDIDLAVEGLPDRIFFEAMGELLLHTKFPFNIIPLRSCPGSLREKITIAGEHL